LFEASSGTFGLPNLDPRYSWISMIDRLANGDVTKYDSVYEITMEEAYLSMEYWKVRDEWVEECNKIISKRKN